LSELSSRPEVLERQVLIVLREPVARHGTSDLLRHRGEQAVGLLAAAGVTATLLDAEEVRETLRRATDPGGAAGSCRGVPGPDSIEVAVRSLRVGDAWCATFSVSGYPREVSPGWLEPLLAFPGRC